MENKHCSCENCFNPVVAQGLCDMHYRRKKRHGSTEQTRPKDWGKREKHPLYDSWCWMRKMRGRHFIEESWEDFWNFVSDLGEKPTPQHKLYKINPELGYAKGNVVWKETLCSSKDRKEYAREWRKANPEKAKNIDLKKRFGIDIIEYNNLREKQNYSCAICGKHESDENFDLAVDHCHSTGIVRGLLCKQCNTGLGHFKDDVSLLNKAIQYLGDN